MVCSRRAGGRKKIWCWLQVWPSHLSTSMQPQASLASEPWSTRLFSMDMPFVPTGPADHASLFFFVCSFGAMPKACGRDQNFVTTATQTCCSDNASSLPCCATRELHPSLVYVLFPLTFLQHECPEFLEHGLMKMQKPLCFSGSPTCGHGSREGEAGP